LRNEDVAQSTPAAIARAAKIRVAHTAIHQEVQRAILEQPSERGQTKFWHSFGIGQEPSRPSMPAGRQRLREARVDRP